MPETGTKSCRRSLADPGRDTLGVHPQWGLCIHEAKTWHQQSSLLCSLYCPIGPTATISVSTTEGQGQNERLMLNSQPSSEGIYVWAEGGS